MCVGGSLLGGKVGEGRESFFLQRPELLNPVNGTCPSIVCWSWKGELPSILLVATKDFRNIASILGHEVVVVEKTLGNRAKHTTQIFPTREN